VLRLNITSINELGRLTGSGTANLCFYVVIGLSLVLFSSAVGGDLSSFLLIILFLDV